MKRVFGIICLGLWFFCGGVSNAQFREATISFEKLNHNFGIVKELEGIVEYSFTFTNTGGEPLIINDVSSSCGCTIPKWSKQPILSGGKGSIDVRFNPDGRPGAFRKEITVKSNSKEPVTTLYIVGLVEARPHSVADEYPIKMSGVRFKTNHLSVMKIPKGQIKTDTLEVLNEADYLVKITIPEVPKHLSFAFQPTSLMPGQKGNIIVYFDSDKNDEWGFVMDRVFLYFNGDKYENNLLAVSGTIEEDFSKLSPADLARAPKMEFEEESFNFGTLTAGEVVKHTFQFKNTGGQTLLIRNMKSTCGCTVSEPSAYEIQPGESGFIQVEFNSTGKVSKQFQTITLITNDPHQPTKLLRIIGQVNSRGK